MSDEGKWELNCKDMIFKIASHEFENALSVQTGPMNKTEQDCITAKLQQNLKSQREIHDLFLWLNTSQTRASVVNYSQYANRLDCRSRAAGLKHLGLWWWMM